MKKFLVLTLAFLVCLLMSSMSVSARRNVTKADGTSYWDYTDLPDTEVYILDEEANEDMLYCKTKTDAEGNVVQTDWYYYCTGEFASSEQADTCTNEFRYPDYECVFAKGSNADKLYCRSVKDAEGNIVETRWFSFCTNEVVKTEESDTCTEEFKKPEYKCYKHEIEEEEVAGVCEELWECTGWSECVDEEQARTCTDKNECGTTENKPAETQVCEMASYCGDGACDEDEDCATCIADCGCEEGMKCVNDVCIKKSNTPLIVMAGLVVAAILFLVLYLKVFKKEGEKEEKEENKEKEVKEETKKKKKK